MIVIIVRPAQTQALEYKGSIRYQDLTLRLKYLIRVQIREKTIDTATEKSESLEGTINQARKGDVRD